MSSLNKIVHYLNQIDKLCKKNDMGDIFSYSKVKEVLIAAKLGHTVPKEYAGADGYNKSGDGVEYKSTIGKNINGTYNGISVQSTWNKQLEYLKNEKIGKYPFHYFGKWVQILAIQFQKRNPKHHYPHHQKGCQDYLTLTSYLLRALYLVIFQ